MNSNTLKSFIGGLFALCTVNPGAQAATLGLDTEAPIIESSAAVVDYFEFVTDGDLSTFGAVVDLTDGVSPTGLTEIGFGVGFGLADPTAGATGGFDVFDEGGLFLGGTLEAVGFSNDLIEFQFGDLLGAGVGSFNSSVLMVIVFDDIPGPNPFDSFIDGGSYVASISVLNVKDVSPVPVPAALPLVVSALGILGWLSRRHRQP